MNFRRSVLFSLAFLFAIGAATSQYRNSLDLSQYLRDPISLSRLVIEYEDSSARALFIYGNGKVIRQTNSQLSGDLLPTCKGMVGQDRIKQLLQGFLDHHFFQLPQRSDLVLLANDEDMRLHSIIIDDGTAQAQRTFAYGTYNGKTEPIPTDFSESEKLLQELEREAISARPCGLSPRISLPKADLVPTRPSKQQKNM
jgi:hypothetical protein